MEEKIKTLRIKPSHSNYNALSFSLANLLLSALGTSLGTPQILDAIIFFFISSRSLSQSAKSMPFTYQNIRLIKPLKTPAWNQFSIAP